MTSGNSDSLCLVTPTWAADVEHFKLMRLSLDYSALADLPHHVIVQTEDMGQFDQYRDHPSINLVSSEDVLPREVERKRVRARAMRDSLGRDATRILTSLARYLGWPQWVRYTGWHTQQLIKLCMAADSGSENVVVLDSDVVVTKHASERDFVSPGKIVCIAEVGGKDAVNSKVRNWNDQARSLWDISTTTNDMEMYFDTPLILHGLAVRNMLYELEQTYQASWWHVLLSQPPRRWSEFATYIKYLRHMNHGFDLEWRDTGMCRYIFDASDPAWLEQLFIKYYQDPESHYITIHSQSSGRQLWDADAYIDRVRSHIG